VRLRTYWPLAAAFLVSLLPTVGWGADYLMYVGSYTTGAGKGIYAYRFDTASGKATPLGVAAETPNPSWVTVDAKGRFLYAANEMGNRGGEPGNTVSAFSIDRSTGKLTFLNKFPSRGGGPCTLAIDKTGKWIAVSNYNTGSVAVLPIGADGKLAEAVGFVQHEGSSADQRRQRGPHAHTVVFSPDNRYLLVADLGLDKVLVYRFDAAKGTIVANDAFGKLAPGSGPRHIRFHPNGKVLYTISEMASTMTAFQFDAAKGSLTEFQTVRTLPADFKGNSSTAEVQVNAKGTVVYGSNRGADTIAVFSVDPKKFTLTPVDYTPSQGRTPRFFTLDPSGAWLVVANQDGGNVVLFKVDAKTGKLTPTGQIFTDAPAPVTGVFVPVK
jgi:6-phosphogluconolactonase